MSTRILGEKIRHHPKWIVYIKFHWLTELLFCSPKKMHKAWRKLMTTLKRTEHNKAVSINCNWDRFKFSKSFNNQILPGRLVKRTCVFFKALLPLFGVGGRLHLSLPLLFLVLNNQLKIDHLCHFSSSRVSSCLYPCAEVVVAFFIL